MKHTSKIFSFRSATLQNKKMFIAFLSGITSFAIFGFYYMAENRGIIMLQGHEVIGVWSTGAPRPEVGGFGSGQSGVGYYKNDTGWVFTVGNASPASSAVVYKYNVNTNTWSLMAPLPSARDRLSCAILKDSIYAIGGGNTVTTYSNSLFKYDIKANLWVSRANVPVNIGWTGSVGFQDSLIYVAGGIIAVVTDSVYLYNAISNTWRTATPLPNARYGGGFSKSGDTLIYAGGLDEASSTRNTVYKGVISHVDRSVISWTTGAPMPLPLYRTAATEWGNKGIILTNGSTSPGFTGESICYVYSPGLDKWTIQTNKNIPTFYSFIGSVLLANDIWKLVCTAGFNGTTYISSTEIFTDTLPGTVGIDPSNLEIPITYNLSQNYPNPFNPKTKINYDLPFDGKVSIKLFDMSGREVLTLINEVKAAGYYTINFNATSAAGGLSSGVYFYTIKADNNDQSANGGFVSTKKMMLVK